MAAILHTPDFLAFHCPLVHKSNHHCSTSRHTATALRNVTSSAFQKKYFHFLQLAQVSQNQSDVPPNLLEARKCVLWKLNSPHLSFFVPSFKLVTTSWQWYCWYSDWSLSNLQNSMQVIQDGPDDDDTNTDNDESTGIIGCNLWWQPSAESNKLVSAVSSKPSDDCNDGVDRDIQTYQQFQNLLLFLSSTEV